MIFQVTEKPWKDPEVNTLAIANELFFYCLLVMFIACSCINQTDSEMLGLVLLLVVTSAIFVNLVAVLAQALYFTKQLYLRKKNEAARKAQAELKLQKFDDNEEERAVKVIPVIEEVNSRLE